MLAGYGVAVVMIALPRLDRAGIPAVIAAHAALPLLAWLSTRASEGAIGRLLRAAYPLILLAALYSSIDIINGFGAVTTLDGPLLRLEGGLFGMQPSRDWWRNSPSTFWSTVFHAAYFSYYLLVPLPVVVMLLTGRNRMIEGYLAAVIGTFLVCYLCYALAPVSGPYYQFPRPTGEFVANAPARLVYAVLARGSAFGAAFPSSHVAATVAATLAALLLIPRLGMLMVVPTALLTVGVVYCQMHYVVDSVAGVAIGLAVPFALRRMLRVTG
ncbi:MAG TPA: phosphatase PAP2 family protein [Gemmatimonadales bacterium]|nr:phosphatase PAP2 family protein [Gemmatimonadales bacterium]